MDVVELGREESRGSGGGRVERERTATGGLVDWVSPAAPRPCRVCGTGLAVWLDYGRQPLANGFVLLGDVEGPRYPLRVGRCAAERGGCGLVQLVEQPPLEAMFNDEYPFLSSSSEYMRAYFGQMAAELRARWQPQSVIEVGCNDGTFLQHFADLPCVGFEPSANVAAMATAKGLAVRTVFFGKDEGRKESLRWRRDGVVDLVVSTHVVTHIPDLAGFFQGVDALLSSGGVLVLEDPSLHEIVRNGELDQFYDEHVYYLSLPAVANVAERFGFEVIDAEPQAVHGGSLRITLARVGAHEVHERVPARLAEETYLLAPQTFERFAERAYHTLALLEQEVRRLRRQGRSVAAYGATSKSTVVFNACGFTSEDIAWISDTTKEKQGKFQPGTRIPVVSREKADELGLPDVWVLSAWNHAKEITKKERAYLAGGGAFLVWVPAVQTLVEGDAVQGPGSE